MTSRSTERIRAWLRLMRAPRLGPRSFARIWPACPDPERLLAAARRGPIDGLAEVARRYLAAGDDARIERDLELLERHATRLVAWDDPLYPPQLKRIADPPPALFVRGDPELLALPQLAIVGSRNPTAGGRALATEFARHLAGAGLTITSGLAIGIDAAAHEGALAGGLTIGVAATGPDRIYPAHHRELAQRIVEHGAIVTELPPETEVRRENFPRRNRLISGLSLGVLVVEAAPQSGSILTARLAGEQGRELFAIPGSIHNPLARGCHALIRDGAKLVETADHILEELGPLVRLPEPAAEAAHATPPTTVDPDYQRLLDALGYDPVGFDQLVARTGFAAEALSSMLLLLQLEGCVTPAAGGRYRRSDGTPEPVEDRE